MHGLSVDHQPNDSLLRGHYFCKCVELDWHTTCKIFFVVLHFVHYVVCVRCLGEQRAAVCLVGDMQYARLPLGIVQRLNVEIVVQSSHASTQTAASA